MNLRWPISQATKYIRNIFIYKGFVICIHLSFSSYLFYDYWIFALYNSLCPSVFLWIFCFPYNFLIIWNSFASIQRNNPCFIKGEFIEFIFILVLFIIVGWKRPLVVILRNYCRKILMLIQDWFWLLIRGIIVFRFVCFINTFFKYEYFYQ